MSEPATSEQAAPAWKPGDRVWLLPDTDKREVKSKMPGVVEKVLPTGRVKVVYVDQRCLLTKTVEPKRLEPRDIPSPDLRKLEGRH